jgi:hypothetical protein
MPHINAFPARRISGSASHRLLCATIVILSTCTLCMAQTGGTLQETNTNEAATAIAQFQKDWRAGKVNSLFIAHVPSDMRFRVEWTPQRLEAEGYFRLLVLKRPEIELLPQLVAKVEKTLAKQFIEPVPVRWAFVFLDAKGERVFSIYTDITGHNGFVNSRAVTFGSDELFKWAEARFKDAFR